MVLYRNKPLVSVCIPTYNSALYLKESLESIIHQTYDNLEIIVSDNASEDNTESIVKSYNSHSEIYFYKNLTNIGCYNNYNKCISLVKGEFIAIYHSDDIYDEGIVEKEVNFLEDNPCAGAVFTLGKIIGDSGRIIGKNDLPSMLSNMNIFDFQEIFCALLKYGNSFLICPTFMARRKIFKEIGLFNEKKFNTSADLEMWLRISKKYPIGIINEKLINRRLSWSQGTTTYNYERMQKADFFIVMDYYLIESNFLDGRISGRLLRQYEFQKSYDCLIRAINLLVLDKSDRAKKLLDKSLRFDTFRALMEDFSIKKTMKVVFIIILWIATKVGLGRLTGIILKKILYRLKYKR